MRFGNFEVLTDPNGKNSLLGGGAFGKTYKARHLFLKKIVALKVLHDRYADDERARERFLREAQAAHELRHPHIAEVLDFGESSGSLYYAMEFCSGGDLEQYLKKRAPVPPHVVVGFGCQISKALDYAHERNFFHRDLKPANVMLASAEGEPLLKLIDFGLVKMGLGAEATDSGLTLTGEVLGTPMFASPEQLREEELDNRSDLFSLGMTLWYLLEGSPPIPGNAVSVMAERLGEKSYDPLFSTRIPDPLRPVLARLVQKNRASRYQSAGELLGALEEAAAQLDPGTPKEVRSALSPATATDSVMQQAAQPGLGEALALASKQAGQSSAAATTLPMSQTSGSTAGPAAAVPSSSTAPVATASAGGTASHAGGASEIGKPPRLQFTETLGDCVLGTARLATDRKARADVLAVQLQEGLASTQTWAGRMAGATLSIAPRLTADLPLVTRVQEGVPYAVCACPEPVRLVQVVRSRGNMNFFEAGQILSQIALILDEAKARNQRYDLHLNRIALAPLFSETEPGMRASELVPLSLDRWPAFLVCIPPRQGSGGMPDHLDDGMDGMAMMTMGHGAADDFLSPNATFAGLLFRLITGGEPQRDVYRDKNKYRPIPNLSREGNSLLANCLNGSSDHETLSSILERMLRAEKGNLGTATAGGTRSGAFNAAALNSAATDPGASAITSSARLQPLPVPGMGSSTSSAAARSSSAKSTGGARSSGPPPLPGKNASAKGPASASASQSGSASATASGGFAARNQLPIPPHGPTATLPTAPQKVPTVVLFAAFASVVILATVIGIGIYIFGGRSDQTGTDTKPSSNPATTSTGSTSPPEPPKTGPGGMEPVKPPSTDPPPGGTGKGQGPVVKTPDTPPKTPEPPKQEPPPVMPKVEPPKPKLLTEVVFSGGISPGTAEISVNGKRVSLKKNAAGQQVLDVSSLAVESVDIKITAPPGFSGDNKLIFDQKTSEYKGRILFPRDKRLVEVPGNADYTTVELTFIRHLANEESSFTGEPEEKAGPYTEAVESGKAKLNVPTGVYEVRLKSAHAGISPRLLSSEYFVGGSAGTGKPLPSIPSWAGVYECRLTYKGVEGIRTFTFDPGLGAGKLVESWPGPNGQRTQQSFPVENIKVDASGNLTAHLPQKTSNPDTYNETLEMRRNASGQVEFECYPAADSGKPRQGNTFQGPARLLNGPP